MGMGIWLQVLESMLCMQKVKSKILALSASPSNFGREIIPSTEQGIISNGQGWPKVNFQSVMTNKLY